MKRILFVAMALSLVASTAMAYDTAGRLGVGFTTTSAPLGVRYWMSDQLGFDAGLGYVTTGDGYQTTITLAVGVPIRIISTRDRANLNVRPALMYQMYSYDPEPAMFTESMMQLGAELEGEIFVTNDFSVRASHGLSFQIMSPNEGDSTSDIMTWGGNWTSVGFYFYFQ